MQHTNLETSLWSNGDLEFQLANIGSEVFRSLSWKDKNNPEYARLANFRALELIDLLLKNLKSPAHLKEIARVRELWLDFFMGENIYQQTAKQWKDYFQAFTYVVQKDK